MQYSTKNIPLSCEQSYRVRLFHYTDRFIRNLRWRVCMYDDKKSGDNRPTIDNHCPPKYKPFPSKCTPPSNRALYGFESDLFSLINSVSFNRTYNSFQRTLKNDILRIKKSNKIILFSDKTNNLYKIDPHNYYKLLMDNITKD